MKECPDTILARNPPWLSIDAALVELNQIEELVPGYEQPFYLAALADFKL